MAILTRATLTFIDLNEIHISSTPPDKPTNNQMWFDTTLNIVKKYNSSTKQWEIVNDYSDQIKDAIDDLVVSGRNLLLDTSYSKDVTGTGGTNQCGALFTLVSSLDYATDIKNKTFTFAFDWEYIGNTPSGSFKAQTGGPQYSTVSPTYTISNTTYYGTSVYTTTFTLDTVFSAIQFRLDNVTGIIRITHPRLFYGEKDLGWTPAPEDTEAQFKTIIEKTAKGVYIAVEDLENDKKSLVDVTNKNIKISSESIDLVGYVTITSLNDPTSQTVIDGNLIKTDTLSANKVKTGKLQGKNSKSYFDLDNGTFSLANATKTLMTFNGTNLVFGDDIDYNLDENDFDNNLDWVKKWTNGSTVINNKQVMSPKAFFGTVTSDGLATGVSLGSGLGDIYTGNYQAIDKGVAGYLSGSQTFRFSTDGSATIGKAGDRQIKIENGTLIIPTIKGEEISAYNLDLFKKNANGTLTTEKTLAIDNLGNVTLTPTTFTLYNGSTKAISLVNGVVDINASTIKSGTLTAGYISLEGLSTKNGGFRIDSTGKMFATGAEISGKMVISSDSTVPTDTLSGSITSGQLDTTVTNDIKNAKDNASAAVSTANTASTNASSAISTANTASGNASTALSTANTAKNTADTAKSTADTASTNAGTAVSTANAAKNVADTVNTTVTNGKSKWDTSYNQISNWASATPTGTTEFDGNKIKTGTIFAEKLAIMDFTNYAELNSSTLTKWGFVLEADASASNNPWFKKSPILRDNPISKWYNCEGGESLSISADISTTVYGQVTSGGTATATGRGITVMVFTKNTAGTSGYITGTMPRVTATSTTTPVISSIKGVVNLADDVRQFAIYIQIEGYPTFTGDLKVRNVAVNKMANGKLIVDGSITTKSIHADGLNADVIKAGTISTDRLDVSTIVSSINSGSTTINGDKIRTGVLQANSGGSYLNLDNGSMLLGATTNANYLQWTGSALTIKATNLSIGSTSVATTTDVNNAKTQAINEAVTVKDTRSTNEAPSWYMTNYPKRVVYELKTASVLGITSTGTYGHLETKVPWSDSSGGYPIQTFVSSTSDSYTRKATSNTAWTNWERKVSATQDDVFNTLTNNLANQGVYLEEGNLYVNASMVNTGTLSANVIATETLNGKIITGGSIDGGTITGSIIESGQLISGSISGTTITGSEININDKFIVGNDGILKATGAEITGKVTILSGSQVPAESLTGSIALSQMEGSVIDNISSISGLKDSVALTEKYIDFVDGEIILGDKNSQFKVKITNTRIDFLQNDTAIAYISNNKLYITEAEIKDNMTVGKFAWIPRSNGNLSFTLK